MPMAKWGLKKKMKPAPARQARLPDE